MAVTCKHLTGKVIQLFILEWLVCFKQLFGLLYKGEDYFFCSLDSGRLFF